MANRRWITRCRNRVAQPQFLAFRIGKVTVVIPRAVMRAMITDLELRREVAREAARFQLVNRL